ncbi:MAG: 50S ribosome-binding GTPase, partial [Oscillospiraceae bacterium]|nr:50S ribosome-binding GTPase [Oscillospiraceae bacterium]
MLALRRRDSGAIRVEAEAGDGEAEIALVGNPNVGKSTLFNRLTGLRQHTGNWPGKTVERAEGRCRSARRAYRLVDLPGCYSLLARSPEERVTRDYLRAGRADAVIVVCDASSLERNLPLALQTAELCPRMLLCVNLMDEAARRGVTPDLERLEKELGTPVLGITAHERVSRRRVLNALDALLDAPAPRPRRVAYPEGAAVSLSEGGEGDAAAEERTVTALLR